MVSQAFGLLQKPGSLGLCSRDRHVGWVHIAPLAGTNIHKDKKPQATCPAKLMRISKQGQHILLGLFPVKREENQSRLLWLWTTSTKSDQKLWFQHLSPISQLGNGHHHFTSINEHMFFLTLPTDQAFLKFSNAFGTGKPFSIQPNLEGKNLRRKHLGKAWA